MSSPKPRVCWQVISKMILEIPEKEVELIEELGKAMEFAYYKAPEETIQWSNVQRILIKFMPKLIEDWQFKVVSIFTEKTIAELNELEKIRHKN